MFNVKIQINNSENERINKDITNILSLSGTLKSATSIVDPVILIECDLSAIVHANYLTIETFGRSYFIKDIISVRTGLCEIRAHCDVISSFKNQILNNNAIVLKQENKWNLYLDDGTFKVYQNPNVLTKKFPTGFSNINFVMAVAGATSN